MCGRFSPKQNNDRTVVATANHAPSSLRSGRQIPAGASTSNVAARKNHHLPTFNSMKSYLAMLIALGSPVFTTTAQAEVVIFDFNVNSRDTISGLGTSFIIGCALLAIGLVIAANIFKSK